MDIHFILERLKRMTPLEIMYRIYNKIYQYLEILFQRFIYRDISSHMKDPSHFEGFGYMRNDYTKQVGKMLLQNKVKIFSRIIKIDDNGCFHRDVEFGRSVSRGVYGKTIDYRDHNEIGDVKNIWEVNRFTFLVPVALESFGVSGEKIIEKIETILLRWMDSNPTLKGINWCSSLELSYRLVNWAFTWQLVGNRLHQHTRNMWLQSSKDHMVFVMNYLSLYSSANNHLLGELAGVYIASRLMPSDRTMRRLGTKAFRRFKKEFILQNHADGINKEQATYYQISVVDMALVVGLTADRFNDEIEVSYWKLIDRLIGALATIQGDSDELIKFGDEDGAVLLDLGQKEFGEVLSLVNTSCRLLGNPFLELHDSDRDLKTLFLTKVRGSSLDINNTHPKNHYELGGYSIIRKDKIRLVFDAGPLGYKSIAAHGHADALSFLCFYDRMPVLIDPGTYKYNGDEDIRNYFRSTGAHNTLVIDNENQSTIAGQFMWSSKADSWIEEYCPGEMITGSHNGYARKGRPVIHTRTIRVPDPRSVEIIDTVKSRLVHDLELNFHFSRHCRLLDQKNHILAFDGCGRLRLEIPSSFSAVYYFGSKDPIKGWYSPEFGIKEPIYTLTLRGHSSDRKTISTKILFEELN